MKLNCTSHIFLINSRIILDLSFFNRLQFSIRIFTFITMCIGQFPSIGSLSLKQFSDLVAWKKKRGEVKTQLSKKALSKIVSQKICHRELVFWMGRKISASFVVAREFSIQQPGAVYLEQWSQTLYETAYDCHFSPQIIEWVKVG